MSHFKIAPEGENSRVFPRFSGDYSYLLLWLEMSDSGFIWWVSARLRKASQFPKTYQEARSLSLSPFLAAVTGISIYISRLLKRREQVPSFLISKTTESEPISYLISSTPMNRGSRRQLWGTSMRVGVSATTSSKHFFIRAIVDTEPVKKPETKTSPSDGEKNVKIQNHFVAKAAAKTTLCSRCSFPLLDLAHLFFPPLAFITANNGK